MKQVSIKSSLCFNEKTSKKQFLPILSSSKAITSPYKKGKQKTDNLDHQWQPGINLRQPILLKENEAALSIQGNLNQLKWKEGTICERKPLPFQGMWAISETKGSK